MSEWDPGWAVVILLWLFFFAAVGVAVVRDVRDDEDDLDE